MPGDDPNLTPGSVTPALSGSTPVEAVWPWLVLFGHVGGGLDSFDGLENWVRCDFHSLDRIAEAHQQRSVGDRAAGPATVRRRELHQAEGQAATLLPRSARPDLAPGQPVGFVMEREMRRGIKGRAEGHPAGHGPSRAHGSPAWRLNRAGTATLIRTFASRESQMMGRGSKP